MTTTQMIECVDSIEKAFRQIPEDIDRITSLRIPSGDYNDFPYEISNNFEKDGLLVLEGLGNPIVVFEGPYEIEDVIQVGDYDNANIISVVDGGLTVDAFTNLFLRLKTGLNTGKLFGIFENGTDTIILGNDGLSGSSSFAIGDTFDIVRAPVRIYVDHPITWKAIDSGIGLLQGDINKRARVVISGIEIISTYDPVSDPDSMVAAFRFLGEGTIPGFYLHFSKLQGYGKTHFLEVNDCNLNAFMPYSEDIFEEREFEENPSFILAMNNGIISTTDDDLWLLGLNRVIIVGAVCRGGIACMVYSYIELVRCIANVYMIMESSFFISACASKSLSGFAGAILLRSRGNIEGLYVFKGNFALGMLTSVVTATSLNCNSLDCQFGAFLGQCSHLIAVAGCDAIGTDGAIYFAESMTVEPIWPLIGEMLTDDLGSIVLFTRVGM
jgi:hypothetical protein